ncbi:MAG: ActS/PrrB/RegB family redox-sensitive histidine kinase [Pseudomonadota bacterium]
MSMGLFDQIFQDQHLRTNWVRLRTLIYLRWLAVLGQTTAIILATQYLDIQLRLDLCILLIGLSASFNVAATLIHPENKRLTQRDATLTLLFDITQLSALLYLTGGLTNPFAALILAQTIIAATVLTAGATILLGSVSLILIGTLSIYYIPLRTNAGTMLEMPQILITGSWAALSISIIFLGVYARRVSTETFLMSEALTATQLALEREQKLTALGGVVAAAAHELGTPLATIMLASTELADELEDRPELRDDLTLIREQTARCRDILAQMGRSGKDDVHMRYAPFSTVITEAAQPHRDRGKTVILRVRGVETKIGPPDQPLISRRSEVIHGVRNLIQNAVDFAVSTVWVDLDWTDERLQLRVGDDGRGYPSELLGRIGDPFLRRRAAAMGFDSDRPNYVGMGLGLFISKTLLERTGARLTFANGLRGRGVRAAAAPSGAIVEVVWARSDIEVPPTVTRGALGENVLQLP